MVVLTFLIVAVVLTSAKGSHEAQLRKQLLKDYDRTALPNVLTHLSVGFTILGIDMDEEKEVVNLDTWVKMEWTDPRLVWDEKLYPNIDRLAFPAKSLWIPDLTVFNNAKMNIWNPITDPLVLAWPSGKVLTVPTAVIPAMCVFDLTYWPHDVQNCTAKLGSWVFSGHAMNLTRFGGRDSLSFDIGQIKGDEVKSELSRGHVTVKDSRLTYHSKYYDCCPEPYMSVELNLLLERNAPAFNWLVKVPLLVLSILTGVLFLFPPGATEKLIFGSVLLLSNLLYLFSITSLVKHSPSHTPLIVKFSSEQLVFNMVGLVMSVLIVRACSSPHKDSLPRWLSKLVCTLQAPFFLRGYYANANSTNSSGYPHKVGGDKEGGEDHQSIMEAQGSTQCSTSTAEWLLFGAVMDRLAFLSYAVIFFIRVAAYSGIL